MVRTWVTYLSFFFQMKCMAQSRNVFFIKQRMKVIFTKPCGFLICMIPDLAYLVCNYFFLSQMTDHGHGRNPIFRILTWLSLGKWLYLNGLSLQKHLISTNSLSFLFLDKRRIVLNYIAEYINTFFLRKEYINTLQALWKTLYISRNWSSSILHPRFV
jgi:predicted SAM-dependent methyltransferase